MIPVPVSLSYSHRNGLEHFEHFDYPNFRSKSKFQSIRASNVSCLCFQCVCPTSRNNEELFHHSVLILHLQPVFKLGEYVYGVHTTLHIPLLPRSVHSWIVLAFVHFHVCWCVVLCTSMCMCADVCTYVILYSDWYT